MSKMLYCTTSNSDGVRQVKYTLWWGKLFSICAQQYISWCCYTLGYSSMYLSVLPHTLPQAVIVYLWCYTLGHSNVLISVCFTHIVAAVHVYLDCYLFNYCHGHLYSLLHTMCVSVVTPLNTPICMYLCCQTCCYSNTSGKMCPAQ